MNIDSTAFKKDLLYLFCVTKDKRIEKELIRFASDAYKQLENWIKNLDPMSLHLQNPQVIGVFKSFLKMNTDNVASKSDPDLIKYIVSNQSIASHIPYIIAMSKSINAFRNILEPFSEIINRISSMNLSVDSSMLPNIDGDLEILRKSFSSQNIMEEFDDVGETLHKQKATRPVRYTQIFTYILQNYTGEIVSALKEVGRSDLAEKFQSGILAKPMDLFKLLNPSITASDAVNKVKIMMKTITKNLFTDTDEEQYNYVRSLAMVFAGQINKDEYKKYYMDKFNAIDFSSAVKGDPISKPDLERMKLSPNQIVNPNAIFIISVLLYGIYQKTQ